MNKDLIEARAREFHEIFHQFQHKGGNFARERGMKDSSRNFLWFLFALTRESGSVKPSDIAKKMGVTMAAVTHQINALEEQGLIERTESKEDRREVLIAITPEGKKKVEDIKNNYWQKLCKLIEFLGEEDSAHLSRIFGRIAKFVAESHFMDPAKDANSTTVSNDPHNNVPESNNKPEANNAL